MPSGHRGQTSLEATSLWPGKLEWCDDITISRVIVNKSKTEISPQGQSWWQPVVTAWKTKNEIVAKSSQAPCCGCLRFQSVGLNRVRAWQQVHFSFLVFQSVTTGYHHDWPWRDISVLLFLTITRLIVISTHNSILHGQRRVASRLSHIHIHKAIPWGIHIWFKKISKITLTFLS